MKILLILLFLIGPVKYSSSQYDYGYGNSKETIKSTKVKSLTVYYFINQFDSILTHQNTYDSLGAPLSVRMFSKDGTIIRCDSFIYDGNNILTRQVTTDGKKTLHETTFIYNTDGKLVNQTTQGDSIHYSSINFYDHSGRLIKSTVYNILGDTTYINNFYTRKGLLVKIIMSDKVNGRTIITMDYNSSGRIIKRQSLSSQVHYLSEFKYDTDGNCFEATTTSATPDKKKSITKINYTFYPNLLTYGKLVAVNSKPIGLEKTYYTYY